VLVCLCLAGCASRREAWNSSSSTQSQRGVQTEAEVDLPKSETALRQVGWEDVADVELMAAPPAVASGPNLLQDDSEVHDLLVLALAQNPRLRSLSHNVAAARARASHVDRLPDPTVGTNIFAAPIETAAGSQVASASVGQRLPWLHRLSAQSRQAWFEAVAIEQSFEMEQLEVVAEVRVTLYRLFVLEKQSEVNQANQELMQSLVRVANGRIAAGKGSQGDVLLGTLELSRLAEQLVTLKQQRTSITAELNRLLGRSAEHPITLVPEVDVSLPDWSHEQLRQIAIEQQPAIAAARLRTEASRWGIEVARLTQRPEVSLGATWYVIDDDRPETGIVDVGRDAWSIGVQMSVPVWHRKYGAIEEEATATHLATTATVEDTLNRYDALLQDLWAQAVAAEETATLYRETIIPQSEQTLKADQDSYTNGVVEFDRVVEDLRSVLTLQLEYYRAIGRLATALARIEQAIGRGLGEISPIEAWQRPPSNSEIIPLPQPDY